MAFLQRFVGRVLAARPGGQPHQAILEHGCAIRQRLAAATFHTTPADRAGHSKWANIRHIKAAKDGQRSLQFIKLSRQIRVSIQEGGSANPAQNTQLRQAIDEAVKRDMPNHTIQNILKKAATPGKLKRHVIEARVLNKVFMVCILYTDKYATDRMTIATLFRKGSAVPMDVRHMFDERGFVEATAGPVAVPAEPALDADQLEEVCTDHAIECGAEELEVLDAAQRRVLFICEAEELERLRQKLVTLGYDVENSEHAYIPNSYASLSAAELAAYQTFKEKLKAVDGVEDIYDNVAPTADE